ncbi:transcription factor [Cantharellus anzutake]|uniref:transcription factor n=1 Tax=Cantharellus anzutake TaxID=1750568 RepID=UPI001902CCC6|nr:transcription factor [Cantharellus anzutake]KAF8310058.1 transcription factor [Cantharellus anzutake]
MNSSRDDEELSKRSRRLALRELNRKTHDTEVKTLDSSLKRHTTLIKRLRQSMGVENHDQIVKDVESLALEKYTEEIVSACLEGATKCKNDKDAWSTVQVISLIHRRLPETFTVPLVASFLQSLAPPSRRDREESSRVSRQRSLLRVCSELALVGIICDGPGKSGGGRIMKVVKDLLSNDPSLSSLPILGMFLKSYSFPYLGLHPPPSSKQQVATKGNGATLSETTQSEAAQSDSHQSQPQLSDSDALVEKEIQERFKRMCEGYFDSISKKLVKEHLRLQEQDRRNHEAYIRSGEIFEDRQQAYEKMTKSYEKSLASCQALSELLYLPLPHLPTAAEQSASQILLRDGDPSRTGDIEEVFGVGKWEDEEEQRFYEDLVDLKDFVPISILNVDGPSTGSKDSRGLAEADDQEAKEAHRKEHEDSEIRRLESEMENIKSEVTEDDVKLSDNVRDGQDVEESPSSTAAVDAPQDASVVPTAPAPAALLSTLLARLPDATNRSMIDQLAVDFAFLNSKAARKRLGKFLSQVPKNRVDLFPHYARLVATLNPYMPEIATELISALEDEFRYLQRKKNVVKELAEMRQKNIMFLSALTKFGLIPPHLILHVFKVFLDDFTGVNIDNTAMLLEGCGRYLMRTDPTKARMVSMVELMRRKQSTQHLDQRQILALENAYYLCNPPERAPRQQKERTPMEQFIHHLIFDVLAKRTIDKVLRLIRKLDWEDAKVQQWLHKVFTKPWKIKFSNIALLSMLTYDLQRYHPDFVVDVIDQVLEDVRRGLETNLYKFNQRRVATIKLLGELYIYRLVTSSIIFDTLWLLVTFGHAEGRPHPTIPSALDAPDDFFRIRLICILLDGCGMCFDRGSLRKKLDSFLVFFQYYVLCKEPLPMDVKFMLSDTIEALRPKMKTPTTLEEAATAVDDMFATIALKIGSSGAEDGEADSADEDGNVRRGDEEEEGSIDEDQGQDGSISPEGDAPVKLAVAENQGPSEEAEAEFAKELAKMLSDTSSDSRRVDKRTALAMWDSSTLSGAVGVVGRKKRTDVDDANDNSANSEPGVMKFTLISRKGNKQQTRELPIPEDSSLALHTKSAQLQDKVEHQQLKQLVLNYGQREEAEELKTLEASLRNRGMKVKYSG